MSGLCLGTVQLGMKYGVKNALGRKPTEEECGDVLKAALDFGIHAFDTASAYGDAEAILGRFGLAGQRDANGKPVQIISKLRPDSEDDESAVTDEIRGTLSRLNAEKLHGYMLHRASDMGRKKIVKGLLAAKDKGLAERVGVSVYEPEEALRAAGSGIWDMVQVPYNVLDQRLDETDFFETAEKNHVRVFARSAFLQGLLLMEPGSLPPRLEGARPYIEKFRQIAAKHEYSPEEGAMLYSYCHPGIDYAVFGVDTVGQLERNASICEKAEGFGDCWQELRGAFSNVPREIIVPSLWQ